MDIEKQISDITAKDPTEITPEDKTFLQDNADSLDDEVKTKYGIEAKKEEEEPGEVETRGEEEPEPKPKSADAEDEEGLVAPEDKELIAKEVDKRMGPALQAVQRQADEAEVRNYIIEHPDFKKYEKKMLAYRTHSAYKRVPISHIASFVSAGDQRKLGAEAAAEAEAKAKASKLGGGTPRPDEGADTSGVPDLTKVKVGSPESKALIAQAKRGVFTKR